MDRLPLFFRSFARARAIHYVWRDAIAERAKRSPPEETLLVISVAQSVILLG